MQLGHEQYLVPWAYTLDNGVTIRGQRTLARGKPVLHFIHGTGFCGLSYWPFLAYLIDDYDLFIHDIQGHGDSDEGEHFWGWNENARVCIKVWQAFAKEYKGQKIIGMGHSFGGVLTALIGAKVNPIFDGLILLDPVFFTKPMLLGVNLIKLLNLPISPPLAKKARKRKNSWQSQQEAKQYFTNRGVFKGWNSSAVDAYVEHALHKPVSNELKLKCSPKREAEVFSSFPSKLWPALKQLNIPTHILYGQDSYGFVLKATVRLKRLNSQVYCDEIAGGHCFMQEEPKQAADHLLTILSTKLATKFTQ